MFLNFDLRFSFGSQAIDSSEFIVTTFPLGGLRFLQGLKQEATLICLARFFTWDIKKSKLVAHLWCFAVPQWFDQLPSQKAPLSVITLLCGILCAAFPRSKTDPFFKITSNKSACPFLCFQHAFIPFYSFPFYFRPFHMADDISAMIIIVSFARCRWRCFNFIVVAIVVGIK